MCNMSVKKTTKDYIYKVIIEVTTVHGHVQYLCYNQYKMYTHLQIYTQYYIYSMIVVYDIE